MKIQILVSLLAAVILSATAQAKDTSQSIELAVTENGFEPKSIDVKPGTDVTLKVTRKTDSTCANQVQVPSRKIKVDLPLNKTVSVALGKLEKGEIRFGCGMNMMEGGRIIVR
ncbi:MAG: cupredoxin domain-containing protein [Bdellovibrionaceae bacterium]|jgi:plastocyanin domain-containing protein|nr:cupredoxin domain-containing protein [Pseudobdellovibrionaceae bacterium]